MKSKSPTLTFTETQHGYASLIKRLGATTLPWGQTLSKALTVDDVPFWEIFATELAYRHLTTAVASVGPGNGLPTAAQAGLQEKPCSVLRLPSACTVMSWSPWLNV
jgi:hypothetical protein